MEKKDTGPAGELAIYFAGSIRGGRDDAALYTHLIAFLGSFGNVLTAHVGNESLLAEEKQLTEQQIFDRDMQWMKEADCVIAEVSTPSLGVGYEIGIAQTMGKKIFCLYRHTPGRRLSAMLAGNPYLELRQYREIAEAEKLVAKWLRAISDRNNVQNI